MSENVFLYTSSDFPNNLSQNLEYYWTKSAMGPGFIMISDAPGKVHDDCCIFPFVYKNVEYNHCKEEVGSNWFRYNWCATKVNSDGTYKDWKTSDSKNCLIAEQVAHFNDYVLLAHENQTKEIKFVDTINSYLYGKCVTVVLKRPRKAHWRVMMLFDGYFSK